ncbi:similar to Type II secretory pathway component PulC [gamma proteobacterium HdN1]|nr:similar to Type II secretory pathway component PulC [gamma proteobacterium HdN1]
MAQTPAASQVWINRAFSWLSLALVVAIAYLLVKLTYLFWMPSATDVPPSFYSQSSGKQGGPAVSALRVDTAAIPLWNLFGREGAGNVAAVTPANVDAPITSLQLELQGVFVAPNEDNSAAIIAEKMREANLYRIGEAVPGNATLAAILSDRVLLNTQGRTEALYFPDGGANAGGGAKILSRSGVGAAAAAQGAGGGGASTMSSLRSGGPATPVPSGGGALGLMSGNITSTEDLARAVREELGSNPQQALKELGLEMNAGNGYKVGASGNPVFSALGARPGDEILSLNGRPLGNPESDLNMIESACDSGSITIELSRGGKRFSTQVPCP